MENQSNGHTDVRQMLTGKESAALGRRMFMRYLGVTAAAGVALSACQNEIVDPTAAARSAREGFRTIDFGDVGNNDVTVLNYAYALEQLEAAFYTQVIATPYSGMTDMERRILTDIRDHEIIHRDLFKAAIGSAAIPGLTPDFSSINFSNRAAVLGAARLFENIGVSAYNGAGQFIMSADYLTLAGKIVSVEARHASIISTLIDPQSRSFAGDDVIFPSTGLEEIRVPVEVLALVTPYIKETLNGMNVRRRA
ncbi:ferritin-like domain-containing protein [Fibrisoma montanum]|uniref:Ferritin-like domain-containing protein n=1 Tax=Fibrisoma montanum TaxID=2305895 RepID=A0A418MIL7_9BACT|nr:ferritin-like domain-containing protein [Fibrisoma montanum]RIV27270.1 ferritin-like domain-containing protein [Fibrisoma montanum]